MNQIFEQITLKFVNNSLEQLYQQQLQSSYIILSQLYSLGIIIGILVIIFTQYIISDEIENLIVKISSITYLTIQIVGVFWKKQLSKYTTIPINLLLIAFQLDQNNNNVYQQFMYGQNLMSLHDILIFTSDFDIGAINNFIIFSLRLLLNIFNSNQVYYFGIINAIISHSVLMLCLYKKCQFSRKHFLLSRQDQMWELIMPHLITKPLFIFSFDKENLKFSIRKVILQNFLVGLENPLVFFLREAKYNDISLENYIYQLTKMNNSDKIVNHEFVQMNIVFQNQVKTIKFGSFLLEQQCFVIYMEEEDKIVKLYEEKINQTKKQQYELFQKFIKKQDKLLHSVINKSSLQNIVKLRLQFQQLIMLKKMDEGRIQDLNVSDVIKKILRQFSTYQQSLRLLCQENIIIKTKKYMFLVYLLDIFKRIRLTSKKITFIQIQISENQQLILTIKGQINSTQSKIYHQLTHLLVEYIEKQKQETTFYFYKIPFTRF